MIFGVSGGIDMWRASPETRLDREGMRMHGDRSDGQEQCIVQEEL